MAERRMFSKNVVHSGAFLELPAAAQLLYFHLGMQADDDGFIDSPKLILRMIRGSGKAFRCLVERGFVLEFPNGVCVLRHWLLNNQIRADRYHPTLCQAERQSLVLDESKAYQFWQPDGNQRETQRREGKRREEESREEKRREEQVREEKTRGEQRREVQGREAQGRPVQTRPGQASPERPPLARRMFVL